MWDNMYSGYLELLKLTKSNINQLNFYYLFKVNSFGYFIEMFYMIICYEGTSSTCNI